MEDHIEAVPLLAVHEERVQVERLLDSHDGDGVPDLGDCSERGWQSGRFEGDGGRAHRGAALRCYH